MWPVINLIPLIGWNYSILTGENISTNESTRIYNRSRGLFPGLQLNLTDKRDPYGKISKGNHSKILFVDRFFDYFWISNSIWKSYWCLRGEKVVANLEVAK